MATETIAAAGILYLNAGRVLLLMRGAGAESYPSTWGFPAGHVEDGETPIQAALRESQEEVGFVPQAVEPLLEDGAFALFVATCGFRPALNDESDGYVWASVDCLPQPLHPGTAEAIALAVVKCATEVGMDDASGKLTEQEQTEADRNHAEREEMPASVFLEPDAREYPVKEKRNGAWVYSRDLLLAAAREARMHGHEDLAKRADAIRGREFAADASGMDERSIDTNGWFEVKDNPISKVGVFDYRGAQIPGAPDPGKMYRVYRPEDELSRAETIDSFKLLPWIDNHAMLGDGAGLTPAEKKGVQGVIGQDVHFDEGTLYGNLKVFSGSLAGAIDAGKRELSCGYRCTYDWTPGVWNGQPYDVVQRNIRGNHLALVKDGRMGPDVAVLDHSDTDRFVFTCDSTFEVNMPDETTTTGAGEGATNGGASLQGLRDQFAAFLPKLDEVLKIAAAVKVALGESEGGDDDAEANKVEDKDAEEAPKTDKAAGAADVEQGKELLEENDAGIENAEAKPAMDEAAITRAVSTRIAARDKLAGRLAKHIGTFDSSAMDEQEVAEYGVSKLGIKGIRKGHEMTALGVYLTTVKAPSERPVTTAAGMDSSAGTWLNKQRTALGR